jgi:hypothetical protein
MLRSSDESAWAGITAIYTSNNFTILWPEPMPALERIAQ